MARRTGPATMKFAIKSVDVEQRTIEGYASTPDLDDGDDIVETGACKFKQAGDVQVFIGHQWRLGALPVGVPLEIRSDDKGLFTKTLVHNTSDGDDLLEVARKQQELGKPLGISIGYPPSSVKASYELKDGRTVRRISSLDLQEYSFTPIPMNEHARVTAVKAADMSDEERRSEIQQAINARSQTPLASYSYTYVVATYADRVIVNDGDEYWEIPYTINAAGEAELGDPVEVEQVWTPKSLAFARALDGKAAKKALESKAGRVLSESNLTSLRGIHDAAHSIAQSAGVNLDDDDAVAENEDSVQDHKSHDDDAIFGGLLELELAVATTR